ncbi:hypothetical protein AC578_10123 [Pseudocercospora eumusae]|uniref:Uncharacterized protein n=1 Tax=Pseudocercospora eumusae TaxID=321146 RepID=A0A139HZ21_9PEZI|nr:hypothetical protein AC578_10123 [Pseudocercospora eumusae]
MHPHIMVASDPAQFDSDLKRLMDSAAAAVASGSTRNSMPTTPPTHAPMVRSPPRDPRVSNKRAAENTLQHKRSKTAKLATRGEPDAADSASRDPFRSSHGANTEPFGSDVAIPTGPSKKPKAIKRVVRRQWDPSHDGIAYEDLLEQRRAEQLFNVDRYVPPTVAASMGRRKSAFSNGTVRSAAPAPPSQHSVSGSRVRRGSKNDHAARGAALQSATTNGMPLKFKHFPFSALPTKVKEKILGLLLVKDGPIVVDFTWLRAFIHGHCRVPASYNTIKDSETGLKYSVPLPWDEIYRHIRIMQDDCKSFKGAMELRGDKTRAKKGPCRDLTAASLLKVSRDVHNIAAPIFYSQNTFQFPWPTTAWMQLESFLATIGPQNASLLRNVDIHAPLWHRGVQEDYVEGAMLDLTSPASRMAIVTPPHQDRLLSAIQSSLRALRGNITGISFTLEHGMSTDRWTGRYTGDRQLIAIGDAEDYVKRKEEGMDLLKEFGKSLAVTPTLHLHHPNPSAKIQKHDKAEFRSRYPGVKREAEKYGWQVDSQLKGRRCQISAKQLQILQTHRPLLDDHVRHTLLAMMEESSWIMMRYTFGQLVETGLELKEWALQPCGSVQHVFAEVIPSNICTFVHLLRSNSCFLPFKIASKSMGSLNSHGLSPAHHDTRNGLPLFASLLDPGGFSRHSLQGSRLGDRRTRHEHTESSSSVSERVSGESEVDVGRN